MIIFYSGTDTEEYGSFPKDISISVMTSFHKSHKNKKPTKTLKAILKKRGWSPKKKRSRNGN